MKYTFSAPGRGTPANTLRCAGGAVIRRDVPPSRNIFSPNSLFYQQLEITGQNKYISPLKDHIILQHSCYAYFCSMVKLINHHLLTTPTYIYILMNVPYISSVFRKGEPAEAEEIPLPRVADSKKNYRATLPACPWLGCGTLGTGTCRCCPGSCGPLVLISPGKHKTCGQHNKQYANNQFFHIITSFPCLNRNSV